VCLFGASSVYDFTLDSIEGQAAPLAAYKGKVLLLVNVASKCGFTPQYTALEALYEKYKDQGLVVIGFPANNFMAQEPGTNEEIKAFCTRKFNVTFPMYTKISVKGSDKAPLYQFLTDSGANPATGGDGAGGGFYINGNASITLAATTGGDGTTNPTQTYTITQGSTTTTIILDNVAGLTTVSSGGTTLSLAGIPQQLDPNTGQPIVQNDPSGNAVNPALLYVNGAITGLNGTVQNNEGITVVASSSVSITGDLTYLQSPVSIPADTLNTTTNAGVLGIFTTGNINLYPDSAGNLTVNASLAAISGGTSGFATPGGSIGTWTIVGGRAEDQAHSVNISTGNTYFDRRFANNFGPPWFPTSVPQPGQAGIPAGPVTMSVTRLSWKEVNR